MEMLEIGTGNDPTELLEIKGASGLDGCNTSNNKNTIIICRNLDR